MILAVEILKYVQPLVPLILGIALLFLLIKESLIQKKILKFRLTITFLIVLVCALLLAFIQNLMRRLERLIGFWLA